MTETGLHEIAAFLRQYPPFDAMSDEQVAELAASVEIEYFAAGTTIIDQGSQPRRWFHVVRTGLVELVDGDQVVDELGPGELFGHPSMLTEQPASVEVRAGTDALCYRVAGHVARPLLAAPDGLRFVARSLAQRAARVAGRESPAATTRMWSPVRHLLRGPPLACRGDVSIREAATRMTEAGRTSIVVELADHLGVVTDRDLRERVICGDVPLDATVATIVPAPAYTVAPDQPVAELLLDMLEHGLRHVPVVDERELLGIVRPADLIGLDLRGLFFVRGAIGRAATSDDLREAAADIRPAVIELHDAGTDPGQLQTMLSVVVDALIRRALDVATGAEAPRITWLTSGSFGRREPFPASDLDSGCVWPGKARGTDVAARTLAITSACGLRDDVQGVVASNPLFGRSLDDWTTLVRWIAGDPSHPKAAIVGALVFDARPLHDTPEATAFLALQAELRDSDRLRRLVAAEALRHHPPRGFVRGALVGHRGRAIGTFDVKRDGLQPIVDLARWAGAAAGARASGTAERLRAAGDAGIVDASDAETLCEAFTLLRGLRMDRHLEQLRSGAEPDDIVVLATLNPLLRSYLRDAFRAVAAVQRHVGRLLEYQPS